jgi:hypothetical protein
MRQHGLQWSGCAMPRGGRVLVLIDESGDPGFRIVSGSTSHFVVAMVIFDDFEQAERVSACIGELREALRVKPEFKFTKSCNEVRDRFFEAMNPFVFKVRALVVDKSAVHSPQLRTSTDSFYNYFLRMLLTHDGGATQGAIVKIDGSGNAEFRKELCSYLRRQGRENQFKKLKLVDSRSDNLIQLADMCAGAILRAHTHNNRKDRTWQAMLHRARQIGDIWQFR